MHAKNRSINETQGKEETFSKLITAQKSKYHNCLQSKVVHWPPPKKKKPCRNEIKVYKWPNSFKESFHGLLGKDASHTVMSIKII